MSIYSDLLDAVSNGKKFKVDLINKSLWINKKQIIKGGEIVHEQDKGKELINRYDLNVAPIDEDCWGLIEEFYDMYRSSVPSENGNKKSYFKALSVDELTDADLAYSVPRDYAQANLEGYILLGSLAGWIRWEYGNNWFWQSNVFNELVVLKNWI